MLKQIQIENFQSHKKAELDFHPGVNIIIGPSDSGKSALLRALKWAVNNRPLGDSFRSNWGGDTRVLLKFDDVIIERFKGKAGDKYTLYHDTDSEPMVLKAFGTEVPEEIKNALNISEINIQNQVDSHYLLSENPGEVSRQFNRVARLEQIDSSLKLVESWVRDIRQDQKSTVAEIERFERELTDFEYLDDLESELSNLELMDNERVDLLKDKKALSDLIETIENTEIQITEKSEGLEMEPLIDSILGLMAEKKTVAENHLNLRIARSNLESVIEQIQEKEELIKAENLINSILGLYNNLNLITDKSSNLKRILKEYYKVAKEITEQSARLQKLEKQWHENMPEICPLCGE